MQMLEAMLKAAKIEKCGAMHGNAYVHPDTLEVSADKQGRPWWPVRPISGYVAHEGFAAHVQMILHPQPVEVAPAQVVSIDVPPVEIEEKPQT